MYLLNAIEVAKADYHIAENEAKSDKNYSGIFESMACINNQIPLLAFHLQRIFRSSPESEKQNILSDIANLKLPKNAVVKYQLIYSPLTSEYTRLINITHPRDYPSDYWQTGVDVCLSALRLSINNRNNGKKDVRRDFYERASQEYLDSSCAETLLLDSQSRFIEGTKSNIFGIKNGILITPELSNAGVAGVMRAFIIQLAFKLGLTTRIETVNIEDLMSMDAVFVSNALIGLWSVRSIEKNGNQMKCWDTEHSTIKILQDNFPTGFMHA